MEEQLYVLLFSNGVVKIGFSSDLVRRVREHAADASRFGIDLVKYWKSAPIRAWFGRSAESALIGALSRYSLNGRREYLIVSFDLAMRAAEKVAAKYGAIGPGHVFPAPDYRGLGRRIEEALRASRIDLGSLSKSVDLKEGMIRLYCTGERWPSPRSSSDLAQALGVTTDWLLTGEGDGPVVHGASTVAEETAAREVSP